MTYQELKEWVNNLTQEQLKCNVTIYITEKDEYFPIEELDFSLESNVIDDDVPIIII